MFYRIPLTLTAAAVLALAPVVAQAATDWSFNLQTNATTSTTSGDASGYGNSRNYTNSGVTVGVSAYSNTGNNGASTTSVDNSNANRLQTARLAYDRTWEGLGVYNRDAGGSTSSSSGYDWQESQSPEHSIDNNERADSVLLSFGTAVTLNSITFGWTTNDSDFFVLAYIGGGTPTLTDLTYATLSGWTLVGNYSNKGTTSVDLSAQSAGITSSYWLIGAGGFTVGTGVNSGDTSGSSYLPLDSTSSKKKFDYLKLTSIGGVTGGGGTSGGGGSAPEPGSLALAGVAFLGMVGLRRRRRAAA
ncbi:exosortase-dependent surface protein XDP1 [Thauera sinica]|uniref:Exosortase-dependent surface protein XDP1 n=2 Tax=Thauera TaxID=33057 RepID=A0ABW1AT75_9RHOO|nr:hypothetical protein CCZ27_16295 [Thauera sp. K11]